MKKIDFDISALFNIPSIVRKDVPRLTLSDNRHILIENHGGILSYLDTCIELRRKDGSVKIIGEGLELLAMEKGRLVISGFILSLEFC